MKNLTLFILIMFMTLISHSQIKYNYGRYMEPTLTLNTGFTLTTSKNFSSQSPMITTGINYKKFMFEYNTDKFTRYREGYTISQINVGYSIGFNQWKGYPYLNKHNKNYITVFGGRYWERVDNTDYLLQDKVILGLMMSSDIRNRFHLWGKVDSKLNVGVGVGYKIIKSRPLKKSGITIYRLL